MMRVADVVVGHEGVGVAACRSRGRPWPAPCPCCRSTLRKNGQRSYIRAAARRRRRPRRRRRRTRVPTPYQPGSISRHCVQPNTHGIARRSSMRSDAGARRRAAADVERRDLADRRDRAEERRRTPAPRTRARGRRRAPRADSSSIAASNERGRRDRGRSSTPGRRLERGGDEGLEVAAGRRRLGVLGGHHLALLGDAQLRRRPTPAAGPGSPRRPGRRHARRCRRGRGTAAAARRALAGDVDERAPGPRTAPSSTAR